MKTIVARITQEESDKFLEMECRVKYALRRLGYDEYKAAMTCMMVEYKAMRQKYNIPESANLSVDCSNNCVMDYTPDEIGKTISASGDMEPPNTD